MCQDVTGNCKLGAPPLTPVQEFENLLPLKNRAEVGKGLIEEGEKVDPVMIIPHEY